MEKSPFVMVALMAIAAMFFAFVAKTMGNSDGAQFCAALSLLFFLYYAAMRVACDLLPARYIRGKRLGRS
ncbi:MAG: hypothetical protein A3C93_06475 [Candidatus Lloydbacteria bacterium RIFCSPHIGHO2_02_FULL_54_17]|uniref:Uncharacterized protein n=1 Tax=Candidatus Lloydbacteria bacterium RIFCSPHIGHO2_02_FULL_54_17 TaxID=1798664 RepID=A0A1G2DID1_9BACT|nr:MAG: hypothetical protein A2762_01460 [Candidatus Lloydbacteria bacterium RIFCSPHIGHO2_01_FULL_54_11]OGZ12721.1 MAG: hypothetical protein A3C93_06475 [Candidatus Lloydbacteria bacterium RIFCSPHIGHO2_02_FULL_54_17]OGZ13572.1 MAG: hypothetical protein A2948_05135 [Candidatus Lloydbacteria bacterium RIFCSPLOWO2_01_FULL_54_18]